MKNVIKVISLFCALTLFPSLALADIYEWTDSDGSVHFSDSPTSVPKGKRPIVRQDEKNNLSPSSRQPSSNIAPQKNIQEAPPRTIPKPKNEPSPVDPATKAEIQLVWQKLRSAILGRDFKAALNQIIPGMHDSFKREFNDPSIDIVERLREVERLEVYTVTEDDAQAGAIKTESDGVYAYPVNFMKNEHGE